MGGGFTNAAAGPGVGPSGGGADNPYITHPVCGPGCTDFPANPVLGTTVPANVATMFGDPDNFTSGSLCVLEPQLSAGNVQGAMIPANWTRPRFRVQATGVDLFEIRLHSPQEANDLVVYTKDTTYYLDKAIWSGSGGGDAGLIAGNGFANNAAGTPVTVTIRGINSASPGKPIGVRGDFNIAPVVATGSMVFWTVNSAVVSNQSSKLLGFAVGDEGVANAVTLPDVKWSGEIGEDGAVLRGYYDGTTGAKPTDGNVRCMGCHASTPDGQAVVFTDDWPWSKVASMLTMGNVGSIPTIIGAGAQAVMKMPWWGTQSMSIGHWTTGDHTLVTSYGQTFKSGMMRTNPWQGLPTYNATDPSLDDKVKWHRLAWIDMESTATINVAAVSDVPNYDMTATNAGSLGQRESQAKAAMGTAYGLITTGLTGVSEVSPSMSHVLTSDGKATGVDKIAFVATDFSPDGHPDTTATKADVYTVDYNMRAGGTAKALPGASDPGFLEYYPSFSADDKLIAFTRAPAPTGAAGSATADGPYYNRNGQVMVIPADGGTAVPLEANNPNTCGGGAATGIINSWPKWSPDAVTNPVDGKTYYFLIFSSARAYKDEFSSQFMLPTNTASSFKGLNSSSQLYLAAIVVDSSGHVTTYPAVYLWNQNRTAGSPTGVQQSNLTPAWDPFKLPPIAVPPPPDIPH